MSISGSRPRHLTNYTFSFILKIRGILLVIPINLQLIISILSQIQEKQIRFTKHSEKRLFERGITKNIVCDCLIKSELKGIIDQEEEYKSVDKSKLYYEYPYKKVQDIIIIITMETPYNHLISVVTAFIKKKE